jgi:hypothetical protein
MVLQIQRIKKIAKCKKKEILYFVFLWDLCWPWMDGFLWDHQLILDQRIEILTFFFFSLSTGRTQLNQSNKQTKTDLGSLSAASTLFSF